MRCYSGLAARGGDELPPGIGSYRTCPSPTRLTTEYESEDHLEVPCTAEREWNGMETSWYGRETSLPSEFHCRPG